jgi:transcriptional repressor NrdR
MIIVKKNGMRESYNRMKVLNGIIRACEKRPVTMEQMEALIDRIEMTLHSSMEKEIQSEWVGELVMSGLKDLDEVAYVRFASVYRQFKDINTFITELTKLLNEKTPLK